MSQTTPGPANQPAAADRPAGANQPAAADRPAPTTPEESRRRIRDALLNAGRVAVGTHAGEEHTR